MHVCQTHVEKWSKESNAQNKWPPTYDLPVLVLVNSELMSANIDLPVLVLVNPE